MKKLKFYQLATAGLLILNLALIALLLWQPKPPHPRGRPVIELFNFSETQQEQFLQLADAHQEEMHALNDRHAQLLKEYYSSVKSSNVEETAELPPALVQLEKDKLTSLYTHLSAVKSILSSEQMSEFPQFVDELMERILLRPNKKDRNHRELKKKRSND